jgi:hypothetical protein
MTSGSELPRLFIGSSTEALDIAYAIQENLDFDAESTVWSQAFFRPSQNTLQELVGSLTRFDFAAFVFAPDDVVEIRGSAQPTVRDNVIFEFGLFFGALGLGRCFFVMPRGADNMHLPTDLLGVVPLTCANRHSDRNLIAALGPACNRLRRAFRATTSHTNEQSKGDNFEFKTWSIHDYRKAWNSPPLRAARNNIRTVTLDHYSKEFEAVSRDMRRIFAFLESLSAAVLDAAINEWEAFASFGDSVVSFWPVAASLLAPPNLRDEYWDPPPRIAELYLRWSKISGGA